MSLHRVAEAQGLDPQFSMYKDQASFMNPALVGNFNHKYQFDLSARDQTTSIATPYRTRVASFEMNLPVNIWQGNIIGIGVNVFQDAQSDASYTSNALRASFSIGQYLDPREEHNISVGFQGGYGQRAIDYSNVYWNNQWVGEGFQLGKPTGEPLVGDVRGYADLSTGLQYTYRGDGLVDARFGIAMQHLNTPEVGLYRDGEGFQMSRRYGIHADMEYRFNSYSKFYVRPSAYFTNQGTVNNLIFGNDFVFMFNEATRTTGERKEYSMSLGLYHRLQKDVIGVIKLNLAGFSFGAAYDANVGYQRITTAYQGALEIFISYKAGFKKGSVNGYHRYKTGL